MGGSLGHKHLRGHTWDEANANTWGEMKMDLCVGTYSFTNNYCLMWITYDMMKICHSLNGLCKLEYYLYCN